MVVYQISFLIFENQPLSTRIFEKIKNAVKEGEREEEEERRKKGKGKERKRI